jgi:15-cis-phytoene synthase
VLAAARASIVRGSRSFALASRLLPRPQRERTWLLYAWCRCCDDLVDGQVGGFAPAQGQGAGTAPSPDAALRLLRASTAQALSGDPAVPPPYRGLAAVARDCAIPRRFLDDHLAGFAADAAGVEPVTLDDLLHYCYRVAGVVGCCLALAFGVHPDDDDTLDRACDLGIAFQLWNIARDLRADFVAGRCYLPRQWLDEAGVPRTALLEPAHEPALARLAARLVDLGSAYAQSARVGAARLPLRSRWAVLTAAEVYGAIGCEVVRRGEGALRRRVVVARHRQIAGVAVALYRAAASRPGGGRDGLWTRPRGS